jgi:hypothetical protein
MKQNSSIGREMTNDLENGGDALEFLGVGGEGIIDTDGVDKDDSGG